MHQAITPTENHGADASRRWLWLWWLSLLMLVAGLMLAVSVLPLAQAAQWFEAWVADQGALGPGAFVLVYIVATVLMVPASAMSLLAGAVFGLWIGTAAVSIGSTMGAAMTFLIGRYLARDKVAGLIGRHPKISAIDQAVGEGGWKIVALLRLSPVVPFNIQNYLYGLTAIRFWPAVLGSWAGMLPGTFMFVYIGYAGRRAVTSMQAGGSVGTGRNVYMFVGLLATLAVTIYVTRLSTRAIRRHTQQNEPTEEPDVSESKSVPDKPMRKRRVIVALFLGIVVLAGGAYARMNPQVIQSRLLALTGPPAVVMAEAYADPPAAEAEVFDHSAFDALLHKHVDAQGWVDYKALADDPAALDAYIASLADAPFDKMGRDEKLAYLINAYNAFTLRLILDHYPVKSIKDIPSAKRWDAKRWALPEGVFSLNQIEHELIRPRFAEPRIHFALVCAAYSCPKLLDEAYTGARLEEQLHDQTAYAHAHDRWLRFDKAANTAYLTALYNWYGQDFKAQAGSVLVFAAGYAPDLQAAIDDGREPKVKWLKYDWKLNDISNAP